MSPGKDVGFFFSLLPEDSYAFWEQAKMQMESPGEKCSARKRRGLLSLFMDTRGLIRIVGAGQNADGVSREEMSPGKDVGCCLSLKPFSCYLGRGCYPGSWALMALHSNIRLLK